MKGWGGNLSEREIGEAAADLDLDIAFGMVLQKLDELGIADNTYVIFTTDHGSPGRNPPLSGGKGTVWEGGLRVPLIIRGPGIKPGTCCHVRAVGRRPVSDNRRAGTRDGAAARAAWKAAAWCPLLTNGGSGSVSTSARGVRRAFPALRQGRHRPRFRNSAGRLQADPRLRDRRSDSCSTSPNDPGERRDLAAEMPDKVQELDAAADRLPPMRSTPRCRPAMQASILSQARPIRRRSLAKATRRARAANAAADHENLFPTESVIACLLLGLCLPPVPASLAQLEDLRPASRPAAAAVTAGSKAPARPGGARTLRRRASSHRRAGPSVRSDPRPADAQLGHR